MPRFTPEQFLNSQGHFFLISEQANLFVLTEIVPIMNVAIYL